MDHESIIKTIHKQTNAIVTLTLLIFVLITFIIVLLSKRAHCGVVDPVVNDEVLTVNFTHPNEEGSKLFKANCAGCHFVDRDMAGPTLKGAFHRQPYSNWFFDFLNNEDSLVLNQEPYTLRLREVWSDSPWTHNFAYLTKKEKESLAQFIQ